MSEKLKPCPCGKVPSNLILEEGPGIGRGLCYGDCCGAWVVTFSTRYFRLDKTDDMERAIDIWNGSMRKELPTPESLAKAGKELRAENERLRAEVETAFQRGMASRKCECGEDSTGWTEFPCCNICGATVENNVDES